MLLVPPRLHPELTCCHSLHILLVKAIQGQFQHQEKERRCHILMQEQSHIEGQEDLQIRTTVARFTLVYSQWDGKNCLLA